MKRLTLPKPLKHLSFVTSTSLIYIFLFLWQIPRAWTEN